MQTLIRITAASLAWGAAVFCAGCSGEVSQESEAVEVECECALKSWRVFARGRHLLIDIDCPEGYEHLSGRVEFTKASLRTDYTGSPIGGVQFARAPLGRMSKDAVLTPFMFTGQSGSSGENASRGASGDGAVSLGLSGAVERVEMVFTITPEQAESLQRDRMWDTTYRLLGPNSNSGVRVALAEIGVALPTHVLESGGVLGEYPGVNAEPGDELGIEQWRRYGINADPGGF